MLSKRAWWVTTSSSETPMNFSNLVIDLVWNFTPDGALIELGAIGCKHNVRWQNLFRMKNVLFCWIKNYFCKVKNASGYHPVTSNDICSWWNPLASSSFKTNQKSDFSGMLLFSSATFSTFHPKVSSFRDKETLKARRPDWHFLPKFLVTIFITLN